MISVLYVDDEPDLLDIVKCYLEAAGRFSVEPVSSASAALPLLSSKKYDAIISDYQMHGMNGIDLLKQVRGSGNTIPFILFTGRGREEVVIQALNEGADFYLQKGGDPESQFAELMHKIQLVVQQRRAEAALAESEIRYRAIVEDQTELICRFTPDGRLTFVNDAYCRYFNLEKDQCLGRPHPVQLPPEDTVLVERHLASLTPEKPVALIEHRIRMPDGTIRWQRWSDRAIFKKDGRVIEYQSVGRDTTDRKQAEDALRQSEEQYRVLIEHTQDGAFLSQDGLLLFCNDALAHMMGYTRAEALATPVPDLIAPEDRDMVMGRQRSRLAGKPLGESYEFRLIHKDRTTRIPVMMSVGAGTYRDRPAVIGTLHNLTKERERESALMESTERLNTAQHLARMGDVAWDLVTGEVTWSDGIYDLVQYDRSEKIDIGRVNREIHHPEDLGRVTRWLEDCIASGSSVITPNEYRIIRRDGKVLYVHTNGIIHRIDGKAVKVFVALQDITERVESEKALKESEERFRNLYHNSPIAIEIYTREGHLVDINPACCALFGVPSAKAVKGFNLFEDPNIPPGQTDLLRSGNTIHYKSDFDFDLVKKLSLYPTNRSGKITLDVLITPVRGSDGSISGYMVQVIDISRFRQTGSPR